MPTPDVERLREESRNPHELVRTSDGTTLFLRHWVGAGGARPAILILHGITAYSEPYGKLIGEELAQAGFEVFGLDLRGHGLSDGIRGDYPSGERLAKDLSETLAVLNGKYARVVVLGHSLGAFSAVVAVNQRPRGVAGLIFLSFGRDVRPGAYAKPTPGAAQKALHGIAIFRRSRLIEYNRPGMTGRDNPLFNFRYSARFSSSIYGMSAGAVVRMLRRNRIDAPNLTIRGRTDIPVLVGVGDRDELFSVDSAQAFYDQVSCPQKEFFTIPGGLHARFPPGSSGPVVEWLGRHFPAEPGTGSSAPGSQGGSTGGLEPSSAGRGT